MPDLIPSHLREKVMRNYAGGNLRCDQLLDLLEYKTQHRCLRARNVLVKLLANHRHSNLRAHNENSNDKTKHYTLKISGQRGIHLRLDAKGTVFQILGDDGKKDLGTVPPWVGPGA